MLSVHGRTGYYKHGCRCEICTTTVNNLRAKNRANRAASRAVRLDPEPLIAFLTDRIEQRGSKKEQLFARWRRVGLSIWECDRFCIRYGIHPLELYPYDFYKGVHEQAS